MPNVSDTSGLSLDATKAKLAADGFTIGAITQEVHPTVAKGNVIRTSPVAGAQNVPAGAAVAIVVSSGPPAAPIKVPDLAGLSQAEAGAKIVSEGFVIGTISQTAHDTVPAGQIIGSWPEGGKDAVKGSKVDLSVSTGSAARQTGAEESILVPLLIGLKVDAASARLRDMGLTVGDRTSVRTNAVPKWAVLSTTPPSGTRVAADSIVDLELSGGPESGFWGVLVPGVLSVMGIGVVGAITYALFKNNDAGLLTSLANIEVARGLITFLIAISTVGIAIIVSLSTVISSPRPDDNERFDRAKQVLTILIGVLGTIVGFYFGSSGDQNGRQREELASINVALDPAVPKADYAGRVPSVVGMVEPIAWSVTPTLPTGLELDPATGQVTGKADAASGKQTYTFKAVDSAVPPTTKTTRVEFEVADPQAAPTPAPGGAPAGGAQPAPAPPAGQPAPAGGTPPAAPAGGAQPAPAAGQPG